MKKGILITTLGIFLFFGVTVFAQNSEFKLPKAGLTPESPFYFLDKLGEVIQEFLTFNPQAKARLQITFAAERIAEIKVILETKGVEAKGLEVAQARLKAHAAKAANIIEKEKGKGKDVSKLAGEIVDNFHLQRKAVKKVFEDAKQEFFTKKEQLHQELLAAIKAGDTEAQERIRAELVQIEAAKDEAEAKKDAAVVALEAEKDRLQDELEERKRQEDEARDVAEEAEEAMEEAEEEKQEVIAEAQKEGVEIPAGAFAKFDNLLGQAKELFARENYQGAKQLAEQAEKSLEEVEKTLERLEETKEKEEEKTEREEEKVETGEKVSEEKPVEELRKEFKVSGQEFSFSPSTITVKAGTKVKIQFENQGNVSHNLIVEGLGIGTRTISAGDDDTVEFTASTAGTYTFFCSVGAHRQLGMIGSLVVE